MLTNENKLFNSIFLSSFLLLVSTSTLSATLIVDNVPQIFTNAGKLTNNLGQNAQIINIPYDPSCFYRCFGKNSVVLINGSNSLELDSSDGDPIKNGYRGSFSLNAMNASGQVVGTINNNVGFKGVVWDHGSIYEDNYLSIYNDINDLGQVVGTGYVFPSANGSVATFSMHYGNTMLDLNTLLDNSALNAGWTLNTATQISNDGWIIGQASNSILGITSQRYLLMLNGVISAVPEPETYVMFIAGLGLIGFTTIRKKSIEIA